MHMVFERRRAALANHADRGQAAAGSSQGLGAPSADEGTVCNLKTCRWSRGEGSSHDAWRRNRSEGDHIKHKNRP